MDLLDGKDIGYVFPAKELIPEPCGLWASQYVWDYRKEQKVTLQEAGKISDR